MIDAEDQLERLKQARKLFEDAYDFQVNWSREAEDDIAFRAGKQWSREDLKYLTSQKRPALTFNLIRSKVLHMMGAAADADVEPAIESRTGQTFLAEVLTALLAEIYEEFGFDEVDDDVLQDAFEAGIGMSDLDVGLDPADPTKIRFQYERIHPLEVIWDPASDARNRSDAQYVCRSQWMTVGEFRSIYPDHASRAEEIFGAWAGGLDPLGVGMSSGWRTLVQSSGSGTEYASPRTGLWFDARRHQIRVVRMQCVKFERVLLMTDPVTGRVRESRPELRKEFEKRFGPHIVMSEMWVPRHYWYDFIGNEMLFEGLSPQPFKGFSITPFVFDTDEQNLPCGLVRPLKDPQREVNKRYSQTLQWITSQSAPGVIAEEDAVADQRQFKEQLSQPGQVAWVRKGAIAQQKVQQRQLPVMPEALARLHEMGIRMVDMISGAYADDMIEPRGIPEAAATTQLKHRRSVMSLRPTLRRWYRYRKEVARKVVEAVVIAMSDEQIAEMLGARPEFVVSGGVISNQQTGQSADMRDIANVNAKIALVPSDENNTERVLEFQALLSAAQLQIPVDPSVLFDVMAISPSKRERLKAFAQQQQMQAQQMAMQEQEVIKQQLAAQEKKERDKIDEVQRSNMADEMIRSQQATWEFQTRLMDIWQRADESEREILAKIIVEAMKAGTEKERIDHEKDVEGARMIHEKVLQRDRKEAKG